MPNYSASPPFPRGLYPGAKGYSFGALTPVAIAASPGGLSRAAAGGVVTCTTSAPHKALPGETATIVGSASVGGTRFDGNYFIQAAAFGSSVLTLVPVDEILLHQPADTGGGGNVSLIQMEQPAAPQAGRAFGLTRQDGSLGKSFFYAEGQFDGAPGAFEIDVQLADIDVSNAYQTSANMNITNVDATNFTFRAAVQDWANFVRIFLRSRTNAVNLAAWLSL